MSTMNAPYFEQEQASQMAPLRQLPLGSEVDEGSQVLGSKICICKLGKITVFLGGNSKNSNLCLKYRFFRGGSKAPLALNRFGG